MPVDRPYIFHLGLNKSGTVSLTEALQRMNIRAVHHPDCTLIKKAIAEGAPPLRYVADEIDEPTMAWLDAPVVAREFKRLDRVYPQARFILTTRDKDDWLASRAKHVLRNVEKHAKGLYDGNWLTVDVEAWSRVYDTQQRRVRTYFSGRPRKLLVMNIPSGDGYPKLCEFLGLPVINEPFPWANASPT